MFLTLFDIVGTFHLYFHRVYVGKTLAFYSADREAEEGRTEQAEFRFSSGKEPRETREVPRHLLLAAVAGHCFKASKMRFRSASRQ